MDNSLPRPQPSAAAPELDPARIPTHVAVIMDGNGRWAAARGLPREAGHRAGLEAVRRTVNACREYGIRALTLYAFSTENWRRPAGEVAALMQLLGEALADEIGDLMEGRVQLRFSGDLDTLDPALRAQVEQVTAATRGNGQLVLNIAYNYGGRAEIVAAVRRLAQDLAGGRVRAQMIDEPLVARYLYTADLPDPDLLIRTGGQQRVSNFLLWQIAYTELYFCDVLWPDFDRAQFLAALTDYQQRRRRFGGVEDA